MVKPSLEPVPGQSKHQMHRDKFHLQMDVSNEFFDVKELYDETLERLNAKKEAAAKATGALDAQPDGAAAE